MTAEEMRERKWLSVVGLGRKEVSFVNSGIRDKSSKRRRGKRREEEAGGRRRSWISNWFRECSVLGSPSSAVPGRKERRRMRGNVTEVKRLEKKQQKKMGRKRQGKEKEKKGSEGRGGNKTVQGGKWTSEKGRIKKRPK